MHTMVEKHNRVMPHKQSAAHWGGTHFLARISFNALSAGNEHKTKLNMQIHGLQALPQIALNM